MRKASLLVLSLFFAMGAAFTVEIDTALLGTAHRVAYIEDMSPVSPDEYNTAEQIRNMGRRLGQALRTMESAQKSMPETLYANGAPSRKYQAIRVYESEMLAGADVLYIAPNATVGTAKALFLIVSGYIETAYAIPTARADALAQQVCWWNTNHYDERTYFTGRFNARVLDAFANETAVIGLADSYKNWAGHARIVIPFVKTRKVAQDADIMQNAEQTARQAQDENQTEEAGAQRTETATQRTNDAIKNQNAETNDANYAGKTNSDKSGVSAGNNMIGNLSANFQHISISYKILFGALCLAALLLIILLIKVIRDMARA
ncbi:MAG: hypothetical protein IJR50_02200 [Treponema sp.]|nr:hypothetical protein [Treponema sp.]